MGLKIGRIAQQGSDNQGEWVSIVNDGPGSAEIAGLELTDYTGTRRHVHIHIRTFPAATAESKTTRLDAGEAANVFIGRVTDAWIPLDGGELELHLYMNRDAKVWNNNGDVAYLRRPDGTFITYKAVGHPARHPGR
jgi:hypothetical protein